MWDIALQWLKWAFYALVFIHLLFFIGVVVWCIWIDAIEPRLIPAKDIQCKADSLIADFADPVEEALREYRNAHLRCEGAEIIYWRRVLRAVKRKLRQAR